MRLRDVEWHVNIIQVADSWARILTHVLVTLKPGLFFPT